MSDIEEFVDLHRPFTFIAVNDIAPYTVLRVTAPSSVIDTDGNDVEELEFH